MTDPKITPAWLAETERIARAATDGPWDHDRNDWDDEPDTLHCIIGPEHVHGTDGDKGAIWLHENDAAHIARMDPATTLALVAEVRRLKREREVVAWWLENCAADNEDDPEPFAELVAFQKLHAACIRKGHHWRDWNDEHGEADSDD